MIEEKIVYSTKGLWDMMGLELRLMRFDDNHYFEILSLHEESFWERLKTMVKYVIGKERINLFLLPISEKDYERLREAVTK